MATFFITKSSAAIIEQPSFNREAVVQELQNWVESQYTWKAVYADGEAWDVLLIRSLECQVAYIASPNFNPHESKKEATYQQVVAIKICGPEEVLDATVCRKIGEWTSAFVVTDNINGIHKNLDRLEGE